MTDKNTVRVRIAVSVGDVGWAAAGGSALTDGDAMAIACAELNRGMSTTWFIEADIPAQAITIEGRLAE